jgi:hypothetical protein
MVSVVIAPHAYAYDCLLMLPALLLLLESGGRSVSAGSFVLLTPVPYLMLYLGPIWLGKLLIVGLPLLIVILQRRANYQSASP